MRTFISLIAVFVAASSPAAAAPLAPPSAAKDRGALKNMVIRSGEVPAGFLKVFSHLYLPQEIASQGTWTGAQLAYWGYEGGFEVQFDRGSGHDPTDPSQISSDVGVYKKAVGARRALAANAAACQRGLWSEVPLDAPIGSNSHLCTLTTALRGYDVQVYFVVWIVGRFKGAVTFTGIKGHVTPDDAVTLARVQSKRMAVAR
jgi:hypothetical protein